MTFLKWYTLIIQILIVLAVTTDKKCDLKTKITMLIIMFPVFLFIFAAMKLIR